MYSILEMMTVKAIEWLDGKLRILDQSKLPWEQVFVDLSDYQAVVSAIKEMKVRGAPAIGVVAAYGVVLGALGIKTESKDQFLVELKEIIQTIAASRPTAVNLFRATDRMAKVAICGRSVAEIKNLLVKEARQIHEEEITATRQLSWLGAELIENGSTVLTHCNAGALATAGYGTALGIIKAAVEQGKRVSVFVTETRPLLQGARLTTWELIQERIPLTLITDSMAGYFMQRKSVDCVLVGADRITANGDVANKIGTYTLAVLAKENGIPFYVAAPTSSIDLFLASGDRIPIEERNPTEITHIRDLRIAPEGIRVANPAFDVTPHKYISAIVTEKGIVTEPYQEKLARIVG